MPTALRDFEHELTDEAGTRSLVFGKIGTPYYTLEHPQITGGDERYGDVDLEGEDGIVFGEDFSGGKTVTFDLAVDTTQEASPHVAGADALDRLESAWKHPGYRNGAQKYAVLRSRAVPGRTRCAYGRPRRYAEVTSRASHRGYSTVACDFQTFDGKWYDDTPRSKSVPHLQNGGIAYLTVGGTTATWPIIKMHGPWTAGAWFLMGGHRQLLFRETVSIPAGYVVTYDSRPWKRTILGSDGANFAGLLLPSSPLMRDMALDPGAYQVAYLAGSLSAYAEVEWRDAYNRW